MPGALNPGKDSLARSPERPLPALDVVERGAKDAAERLADGRAAPDLLERLAHAERELEMLERRLEETQALAKLGSWEWDVASDRVSWSRQLFRIFGLDPDAGAPGHHEFLARVHPDDRERVDALVRAALAERQPGYTYECRIVRPDGEVRVLDVRADVSFGPDGRPLRSGGVAQDITERRRVERERESAEFRLAEAEVAAGMASWEWELTSGTAVWSPQLYRLCGVDESFEPTRERLIALVHPDDREQALAAARRAAARLEPLDVVFRIVRPDDGSVRRFRSRGSAIRYEDGRPARLVGTIQDVTAAYEAEAALRDAEDRFGTAFDDAAVGMALMAPDFSRHLRVNRALCELTGRSAEELLAGPPSEVIHPEDRHRGRARFAELLDGRRRSLDLERRFLHPDGRVVTVDIALRAVPGDDGRPRYLVAQCRDVTAQRRAEAELRHQALHSPLTGLPNRTLLLDRAHQAVRHARRAGATVAAIALNLDRFKSINEGLGLAAGDEALALMGRRLAAALRASDTLAHLGGDDFVALCDVRDGHEALELAERLQDAALEPLTVDGEELRIGASVGIAVWDGGEVAPEDLIRDAETALSRAKERGYGTCEVFDLSLREELLERVRTERELRRALDAGELVLHYQPLFALDEPARPSGAEALVRWAHPREGILAPARFLPVAEQSGLIHELGGLVLLEACVQAASWPSKPCLSVSVNVSPRQLSDPGFSQIAASALCETGIDPSRLVVEITETALLQAGPASERALAALRELGVRVYLDDFGTGYSSLSHLRRFPVDGIKIDRSFVADLDRSAQALRIVEAIVAMANALGLQIVAEGVETDAQLELVRRLGCHRAQGYLLGRPADARRLRFA